jgi:hypothetical protein
MLDPTRNLVAHGSRIGWSLRCKIANPEDVTDQFGGKVPDEIWEVALCDDQEKADA